MLGSKKLIKKLLSVKFYVSENVKKSINLYPLIFHLKFIHCTILQAILAAGALRWGKVDPKGSPLRFHNAWAEVVLVEKPSKQGIKTLYPGLYVFNAPARLMRPVRNLRHEGAVELIGINNFCMFKFFRFVRSFKGNGVLLLILESSDISIS